MNKNILSLILLASLACTDVAAQKFDTRTNIANFFKFSQNDFGIDSKSVITLEKDAYTTFGKADTDTDGQVTYSEYLNYLKGTSKNY